MYVERYMLYNRDDMYDRINDGGWRSDLADALGYDDPGDLTDEEVYGQAGFEDQIDFEEEVARIGRRFGDRCEARHPEWDGRYQLMARGTVGRWDGISSGHNFYSGRWEKAPTESHPHRHVRTSPFESLVTDTWQSLADDANDSFGLFKDCEIDQIWEDREGTIHVRGIHHDGEVNVEVRAVAPDTEERENDRFLAWYVDDYDQDAHKAFLDEAWKEGVTANMAGYYGYQWPSLGEESSVAEVRHALNMGRPVEVAGYRIDGCDAARLDDPDGEAFSLDLIADDDGKTFAYYCSELADEAGGVLMFEIGHDGPFRLCSDNWLASDDYAKTCDRIASSEVSPAFESENAKIAVTGAADCGCHCRVEDEPARVAASARECARATGTFEKEHQGKRL